MSYRWFIAFILLASQLNQVDAQVIERELTASSGGFHAGSNFLIDWSLGEVSIESYESQNLILSQGFHQPGITFLGFNTELTIITSLVFPNPCLNRLNYTITTPIGIRSIQVISAAGIVVKTLSGENSEGSIDFEPFASGSYMLKIVYQNDKQEVHRIIKY